MLQCSRRRSHPMKRKWISSMMKISDAHLADVFGVDYFPECISCIILYLEKFDPSDSSSRQGLDKLMMQTLLTCSSHHSNSLMLVLQAHGWVDESFFTETSHFSAPVFRLVLTLLYFSQIWKMIRLKDRRSMMLSGEQKKFFDDDNLVLAFVPTLLHNLVDRVAPTDDNSATIKCSPVTFPFEGACLLADISGFTKMSARFCEQGLNGLDDLHHNTSGFLGQYVRIVYAHGGDVIAFAGDALVCVFTDTLHYSKDIQAQHTHMELCCASAFSCGLKLVEMRTELLTSHVGISCGDMQLTSLGGYKNEWTFVLTGNVLSEMSSCIDDASSRQVGISANVYECLNNFASPAKLNGTVCESGNYIFEKIDEGILSTHIQLRNRFKRMCHDAFAVKLMRKFVPRPVLHAIMYGTLETISELRTVTTVFLKLDTYCPVKNADPLTLQPFFEMAQRALSDAGGFCRQFLIDDKGCVLIAMWGVPSYTFKNNNARAVSFALHVHKGVSALEHRCSIGVTTGEVFCGNVGSMQRRDYVGIGARVNLAARLMSKAKGNIFIDEETASSITCLLPKISKSEGMQLKGYTDPIFACVLDGTESFDLSTKGTVSSTYVQAGVTKQVMALINCVSTCRDAGGRLRSQTHFRKAQGALEIPSSGAEAITRKEEGNHNSRGISFIGGLDNSIYEKLYCRLPCPDADVDSSKLTRFELSNAPRVQGNLDIKHRSLSSPQVSFNATDSVSECSSRCMVIEAQSGGGKSGVALLFSSYSSKCAMPSYVVKLKNVDQNIDHCVFRKLFMQMAKIDKKASLEDQNLTLSSILNLCNWPNRPHLEDRVEALAKSLGFRESSFEKDSDNFDTDASEIATALRDVVYFLLGQHPCSVIIEHGHFADALSWSDLHYLLESQVSVAILVTARVGSNREDFSKEIEKFEDARVRRRSLKDFQVSIRSLLSHSSKSGSSPNQGAQISPQNENSSRRLKSKKSNLKSFEHYFELDEPEKENKIAYDRAHYTESYNQLISHKRTVKLELPQLEVHEIGHLFTVDLHWHEEDIHDGLLEKMHQITHGNSYWCKEVAHFVSVRGQESFTKNPISALGTVVVTKVNEKLTMEQQITLKIASVIGYVFTMEVLRMAVPERVQDFLMDSIMYLADHNFLTKLSDDPLVYSFPNSLIKDILHDLSPPSERSNLHLKIAQQVEGVNEHNLEPYYELLSYHYSHTQGQEAKDLYYKIESARKILPLGYFDDLHAYLEGATALTVNIDDLSSIKNILEMALYAIESCGPRSARGHRRPSLDASVSLCNDRSTTNTPRDTAAPMSPRAAELPLRLRRLEAHVLEKMEAIIKLGEN